MALIFHNGLSGLHLKYSNNISFCCNQARKIKDNNMSDNAIEAYIAERSNEELLTIAMTARESLKDLKEQYGEKVRPIREQHRAIKKQFVDYMTQYGIDCIKFEDWYLRLYQRSNSVETLGPKLIASAFAEMTPESFAETLTAMNEERQARLVKWQEAKKEEARKELRKARAAARKRRKPMPRSGKRSTKAMAMAKEAERLGDEASSQVGRILDAAPARWAGPVSEDEPLPDPNDDAQVAALAARYRPEDPGVTFMNKGKAPQRAKTPFGRPMTKREVLSQVIYDMVKNRHKAKKPVIEIKTSPGRCANERDAATLGESVLSQGRAFRSTKTAFEKENAAIAADRGRFVDLIKHCRPRLMPHVKASDPESHKVRRILPGDGENPVTVSVAVVKKTKLSKQQNLWDTSEIINDAVDKLGAGIPDFDAPFSPADVPALMNEKVMSPILKDLLASIARLEASRTVEYEELAFRGTHARTTEKDESEDYLEDFDVDFS